MSDETPTGLFNTSKKTGTKAVAVVGLCVVACKVPFLLALFGFGSIGATASVLELPPLLQAIGVAVGVLGIAAVVGVLFHRKFRRANS